MTIDPKTDWAPHDCPDCGHPAYVGGPGMPTVCTNRQCPFYDEDCWVAHVLSLPDDEGIGEEFEIENEDTIPFIKMPSLMDMLDADYGKPGILDGLTKKK